MDAMAAVVNKRGSNAVLMIVAMLRSLMHRGTDGSGVAAQTSVKIARSLEELEDTNLNSNIAIGHNLLRITSRSVPQPVFQRDNPVCAFHKVELRLPFTDCEVVNFAFSLLLKLKIASIEDLLRKRVLRKVAESLEIPDFIANRTKKAVQYATGVNKALRKSAKSEGLTVGGYLKQLFYKTFPYLEASP